MASVCMFLLLWLLFDGNLLVLASLGSTGFIVFALPHSRTARARNVVGGQLAGLACGALMIFVAGLCPVDNLPTVLKVTFYALSVGTSLFVMVATRTEHPPGSGTALGIAMRGFSWQAAIAVIVGAVLLALMHRATHELRRVTGENKDDNKDGEENGKPCLSGRDSEKV